MRFERRALRWKLKIFYFVRWAAQLIYCSFCARQSECRILIEWRVQKVNKTQIRKHTMKCILFWEKEWNEKKVSESKAFELCSLVGVQKGWVERGLYTSRKEKAFRWYIILLLKEIFSNVMTVIVKSWFLYKSQRAGQTILEKVA